MRAFDVWGEPAAQLNMDGKTEFKTTFGGLVGFVVAILMFWFTQTKVLKLISRDDPAIG